MQQNQQTQYLFRDKQYSCSIDVTLAVIGGKWKTSILWHLSAQTMRFSELQRQFRETTRKMLTQQLRELEQDGLVQRKVYPQVPPKVEYSLTAKGRSVIPILNRMCEWGREYLTDQPLAVQREQDQSSAQAGEVLSEKVVLAEA